MSDDGTLILNSSLGAEMGADEAKKLAGLMTSRELADGDFLITEGTVDNTLNVLVAGKLEVIRHAGADETASLAVLREGDLAGELSFLDGEPHTVGLRALTNCRVLCLSRDSFESIIASEPQLVYKVMRAVARAAHRTMHRMNTDFIELSNYIFKQHGRY